jgi:hypothetical protein
MNELLARWKTEMPEFFKNISAIGKVIFLFGGIVMAACIGAPELVSPNVLHWSKLVASYMVFGGGIMAAMAQLTVKDTEELQNKINEKDTNTGQ